MNKKIRAVPAILTDDPIALGKMVLQTESFTNFAQFDIMDKVSSWRTASFVVGYEPSSFPCCPV